MKKNISQDKSIVSQFDCEAYKTIRKNVCAFLSLAAKKYDKKGKLILDIAPQIHEGAGSYFRKGKVETLDLNPESNSTYIADITKNNRSVIKGETFDVVVCTEVLEHTLNPFEAVQEIYRILKPKGVAFISVPFNFRIHGPLPDCWRFTEHGLRELLKKFNSINLEQINTEGRQLMPVHYTIIAKKKNKNIHK